MIIAHVFLSFLPMARRVSGFATCYKGLAPIRERTGAFACPQ